MKTSGQYFIDDGTDIRIGCSEDIESMLLWYTNYRKRIEKLGGY